MHRKKRVEWEWKSERSTSTSGNALNVTDLRRRRIALGVLLCSLQYCRWLKPWKIGSFISLLETPTNARSRLEKHFWKGSLFSISFYVSFTFSLSLLCDVGWLRTTTTIRFLTVLADFFHLYFRLNKSLV